MYTFIFMLGLAVTFHALINSRVPTDLRIIMVLTGAGLMVLSYGQPN